MRNAVGYEGSGTRNLEANEDALQQAKDEMEKLKARAEAGENVDNEIRILKKQIGKLNEDKGRIVSAGMV